MITLFLSPPNTYVPPLYPTEKEATINTEKTFLFITNQLTMVGTCVIPFCIVLE